MVQSYYTVINNHIFHIFHNKVFIIKGKKRIKTRRIPALCFVFLKLKKKDSYGEMINRLKGYIRKS